MLRGAPLAPLRGTLARSSLVYLPPPPTWLAFLPPPTRAPPTTFFTSPADPLRARLASRTCLTGPIVSDELDVWELVAYFSLNGT